jgi:23S rRNA (adenine-N6)-dimethyltransferase
VPVQRGTRWGWHELDSRWAQRLVAGAGIEPGDLVLDIGAGSGAITEALHSAGARVVAIELHVGRAALLSERWSGNGVKVVRADASDLRLPRRPFKVVSNPPFAITSAVVRRLVSHGSRLTSAHLIVPRYAACRWTDPSAPGRGRWQRLFDVQLGRPPPRSALRPVPPGEISLLIIKRETCGRTPGSG